jgi:uncharacterized protein YlxP (DUF503 family)
MLIAAALIELELSRTDSIKEKRRVVKSILGRVEQRFRVSVAEVADQDHRSSICIGCVKVGIDPKALRGQMQKVIRFVESLGLAELVSDEVTVATLAELAEVDEDLGAGVAEHDDELDLDDELAEDSR